MFELERKYIELLLKNCLNFDKSKALFISFEKENRSFVDKVVTVARKMGIDDIYLEENDSYLKHDILKNISLEEIDNHYLFNKGIWDEYAKKQASFLMFATEIPGLMEDVEAQKLARASFISTSSRPIYKEMQAKSQIPWCICALPTVKWAEAIFPNDDKAYNKLLELIGKMCMLDTDNPIDSWEIFLKKSRSTANKLNDLNIRELHYTNSRGTDLHVTLPDNYNFASASDGDDTFIANMPSYEIFSSPNFRKTEGIVYSSRPLIYNGGLIDNFYVKFKEGRVIDFGAEIGQDILKGIIESDEQSSYLGEIALVDIDTPISKTGIVFGSTLFDENASCHLALGAGFPECVLGGIDMSREKLLELGINDSKTHVDFMIGTDDLNIVATTPKGDVLIFKNGHFNI